MIKTTSSQQQVQIPTLTVLKAPPSSTPAATASSTCGSGSTSYIPHYSHKKAFHKDCFSFAGVIYARLNINVNLTTTGNNDEMKYSEMVKQKTNVDNREFFEQFLFKKNRRGLINCLTIMEKIKYQLSTQFETVSIIRIYEKIIRKYLINVVDVKNSDNIDTVLSSSANSLLGISRELQRKICEKFENFIRTRKQNQQEEREQGNDEYNLLWNSLFTSPIPAAANTLEQSSSLAPNNNLSTNSEVQGSNNSASGGGGGGGSGELAMKSTAHDRMNSISHFFKRFSIARPNSNKNAASSPSSSGSKEPSLQEQAFMNQLEVKKARKRGNSMTFRFKILKDDQVKQLYETFPQTSLKMDDFVEIFDSLHNELIKQLKILFDQYVEDSDEYEMFLIDRIQKRNPNDFPELFNNSKSNPKLSVSLLNVSTQSKSPSPNTSSLTREHSFPPTMSNSSAEEVSTCESISPCSPSNDQSSPINVMPASSSTTSTSTPSSLGNTSSVTTTASSVGSSTSTGGNGNGSGENRAKPSIPQLVLKRNSSDYDGDTPPSATSASSTLSSSWNSHDQPMASPRKFFGEKKKKKKEQEKTVKKVQTIQEQMNKYNKIISSLYKDLIERDVELQKLKLQLAQLEGVDLEVEESMATATAADEIANESFDEIV